jgi:hypothetical protein
MKIKKLILDFRKEQNIIEMVYEDKNKKDRSADSSIYSIAKCFRDVLETTEYVREYFGERYPFKKF